MEDRYVIDFKNMVNWPGSFRFSSDEAIAEAIDRAYGDAKRTMKGIKDKEREKAKMNLAYSFHDYFDNAPPSNEDEFDDRHEKLCKSWINAFSSDSLRAYGKAQKIVNMTFKYLYCCDDAADKEDYFRYCHMPLDSFILEWFKRTVHLDGEKLYVGKISSWSNMQKTSSKYYTYGFYVKWIREYCRKYADGLTPLQLEFKVWPEIQAKLAAETFLFTLLDSDFSLDGKKEEKEKIRTDPLQSNYKMIRTKMDEINGKP